ncbi:MAG: MatE family [Candidatus Curtissbacteria bacterium GW2011_GWC2_38_9]|uniref:Uncharacterized protein n=3 Tax=Candidatus Curtissiibacteriota TaxID=1752717 RepID=A0A1F5HR87_9BACT|nr:MAG: MatE family [Candidatus Curtissbacteria bacterium GW2011_GWC2_38_9]KKS04417.1 MAG: MatE family [Candidatus Curtissbacteria bacterium GW2011_GWA2_41_24]OGD89951.1 MAG: hypothetical protein A2Z54_00795 [Candidatus Curtissbacteria bacterium RIFCSPHIGHO2_02_39_8]OGE06489.1 MAG: hypothetical protein A2W70_01335 [Candidatus Curtissbacteria bacterium RIFCSPLOWO2_02_41_11]
MIQYFKNLLLSDTGKDTGIVLAGTLINVIIGGLFFILAPRILGPADYGLFATVVATGLMAAAIANFGIDTGILRFAKGNREQFNKILSLAFKSYIILGVSVALIGVLLSGFIANFLNQPSITTLLRLAFSGSILLLLTNFFIASLQAKREFLKASIVNILSNTIRLLILAIGAYFFTINLYFITALFFFVTIISVAVGKLWLPFEFKAIEKSQAIEFYKYNFWIASALVISSIPFDNYFLIRVVGPVQAGLYSAPFKLLTFAYQFGGNFTRVLASRFASFDSDKKARDFAFRAMPFPLIFILGLTILFFISQPLVTLVFGKEYIQATEILQILSIGFIFFFASTIPSSIILYYFGKPKISFVITLIRYVSFVVLLALLVPLYSAKGGAFAFSVSEFFAFLFMSGYVFIKFSKNGH